MQGVLGVQMLYLLSSRVYSTGTFISLLALPRCICDTRVAHRLFTAKNTVYDCELQSPVQDGTAVPSCLGGLSEDEIPRSFFSFE